MDGRRTQDSGRRPALTVLSVFSSHSARMICANCLISVQLSFNSDDMYARLLVIYSKGKFLYSAASSPQDLSKRFTLYFPDRPVHSDTISASLGSIQPYATINARRLLVHISTTVYSQLLIYSAEWKGAM